MAVAIDSVGELKRMHCLFAAGLSMTACKPVDYESHSGTEDSWHIACLVGFSHLIRINC